MTKWYHEVSRDWMVARQSVLSATDIKQLLPVTKTGRARKVTDEDYLKVLASKIVEISYDDCCSTGAAARGHILEPYAIEMFNEFIGVSSNEVLHHWDDFVVASPNGILGFSPDALNFKQEADIPPIGVITEIDYIGEVKCYGADRHLICGRTPKEELEERWQIAAAMATCEKIDHAWLIFFNPSMTRQMYVVRYGRVELADEIETCLGIAQDYKKWRNDFFMQQENNVYFGSKDKEIRIIAHIMEMEKSNPVKSVM